MKTKRLVLDALCAALYVVLANFAGLSLGSIKLSLDGLVVLLSASLFGPADGLIIGLLGNFLSQLLGPYGMSATVFLWMLPPGILGLVMGFAERKAVLERPVGLRLAVLLALLVMETTLTTGVMWLDCRIYGYSFVVTYAPYVLWRYAADVLKAVIYGFALPPLTRLLRKELP